MIAATGYAQQLQQEEIQCDLELIIKKVSPHLTKDEVAMLAWGCGITMPKETHAAHN